MQLTYEQVLRTIVEDDLAPEDTRGIPFFGFVTGSLISLGLWGIIGWAVWVTIG